MSFVHLHCHTEYSMLDGASRISDLVARCKRFRMPAMAQTDHGGMFGAVPFYEACSQAGVKPIIGCELYMATGPRQRRDPQLDKERYHVQLLAEDMVGYRNLLRLVTAANLEGFYIKPRIDMELLERHHQGLVMLTGCLGSPFDQALLRGGEAAGKKVLSGFLDLLGRDRVYVEMMWHGIKEQKEINPIKARIAAQFGLPVVATNDCHYTDQGDARLQDLLICIGTGKTIDEEDRLKFEGEGFWFKSPEEMLEAIGEPEWLARTLEVAERCNVEIPLGEVQMPRFVVPEGFADEAEYLRHLCYQFLRTRYDAPDAEVADRLEYELDIIIQKRYAGYLLVVWDICRFSRESGILIGFRGSAGGSLVAYVLGIHDLDPLKMGLFFERFLNPERDDPPDIDLDLPDDRRQEVIDYVARKYGTDHVAQVCTFGTMASRAAIRDAGRALGVPLADVDRVAKMIPGDSPIRKALETSPDLKAECQRDTKIAELLEIAPRLEGLVRHASTHAAAVVISNEPLVEYTPLFRVSSEEGVTTQYEMDALKRVGVEKFDLLGLKTLTVLANALKAIERRCGLAITLRDIPLDDAKTFKMLSQGETNGVFQLESAGMKRLVMDLEPERIDDMIPLVALYRPGPLQTGMTDQFVRRRKGREKVRYVHRALEPVLRETFGVMVYQEQIMQAARDMGGFTLGQADILRSAMGKKKMAIMDAMRPQFVQGAMDRGHDERQAGEIFDQMAQFAGYCFNKPHSAMYGIIAYYTAYLKANYPGEFMAAQLTSYMDNKDRVAQYIDEAAKFGISVRPPDINESFADFTVDSAGQIRFGLAAIKGIGRTAVDSIIEARSEKPFASIFDFCRRLPGTAVNRAGIEALIRSGAFDRFGFRSAHLAVLDTAYAVRQKAERDRAVGQESLFGSGDEEGDNGFRDERLPDIPELDAETLLADEKNLLGFYVTDNPLKKLAGRLRERATHTASTLGRTGDRATVTIGGVVGSVRLTKTKKGDRMCFATVNDHEGAIELVVFPRPYAAHARLLVSGAEVLVTGKAESGDESSAAPKILVDSVAELPAEPSGAPEAPSEPDSDDELGPPPDEDDADDDSRAYATPDSGPAVVHIRLSNGAGLEEALRGLRDMISQHAGDADVVLHVPDNGSECRVALGGRYRVAWGERLARAMSDAGVHEHAVWVER